MLKVNSCIGPCVPNAPQSLLFSGNFIPVTGANTEDYEKVILCDPATGDRIIVVSDLTTGVPITSSYNLDGTPYAGALSSLESCAGGGLESDILVFCEDGVNQFFQHIVKDAGVPTGDTYWTDITGAVIAQPTGALVQGNCVVAQSVSIDVVHGCDSVTEQEIARHYVLMSDNTTQIIDHDLNGVPLVSNSSNFTVTKSSQTLHIDDDHMFATNVTSGDATYGLVLEVEKRTVTDGATLVSETFHAVMDVPVLGITRGDDITALINAAPFSGVSVSQQQVTYDNINFDVTGAVGVPLTPASPALAGYARAEIGPGTDGQGVRYTTDGTLPTDTNGQLAGIGGVIELHRDELGAFQALPVGTDGMIDTALTTSLSFEIKNIPHDED